MLEQIASTNLHQPPPALSAALAGTPTGAAAASSTFSGAVVPSVPDTISDAAPKLEVVTCEAALTESEEYRVGEANRRQEVLTTVNALKAAGVSRKSAAKQVGESVATIWRWEKAFARKGYNGLLPDTDKCGRKTVIEKLGVPQEVIDMIRGINLDTESPPASATG